jgi:hypothetical protein
MEQDNMLRRLEDQERRLLALKAELQVIRRDVDGLTKREAKGND